MFKCVILTGKCCHKFFQGLLLRRNGSPCNLVASAACWSQRQNWAVTTQELWMWQDLALLFSAEKKGNSKAVVTQGQDNPNTKPDPTWVHEIFQGTLTNETRCLNCETVGERRDISHFLLLAVWFLSIWLLLLLLLFCMLLRPCFFFWGGGEM